MTKNFAILIAGVIIIIVILILLFSRQNDNNKYLKRVTRSMYVYSVFTPNYTYKTVREFECISLDYYNSVNEDMTQEDFEKVTKTYILALNELQLESDYTLIETTQRELIFEFMESIALEYGLVVDDEFTLQYREW
ncbi:hypothetical protein [Haloplasma contractile]|uniref:Uncharacterized protein n=1 Tax=Haloplasma contractile SSD-17B TaxID=1033810 RepID=U2E7F7_9MOLU|nr:hypothetical protein [Haloplasma contractile]ERJ11138.1 hypothetical protein HLPCO_002803 [Haloplasma contractile SSD-17B]